MKKSLVVTILAIGFALAISFPADARRQKGISAEDVRALQNIGIDLRHASAAEINRKAAAIERLVKTLKDLSNARILEAKARQEEAKAAKAEIKLQQQLQKAGYTQQKRAAKQQRIDAKNDPFNPYERTFSKEINRTFRDFLSHGRREVIRDIFK
ncbi:MAG: hypothetical protein U9M90_04600 [Patescibacteria group bacterium]|nr:hypothetical protein [Patescibacteria group bacterium]